jgi:ferredoxin-NADP reductase
MALTAQNLGLAIGWLLVGWVSVRGLVFILGALRRRVHREREYRRERAEFCRTVAATARAARASQAIADWTGWRPFRVAAIVDEAHDVKSYYFAPVDGRPLPSFAPGQYLTFRLPLPGGQAPLVRCYSLSDRPRQDFYRCTIKRLSAPPESPGAPPGRGSGYFHDQVQVDDVLEVRAPAGTFLLDGQSNEPIVLLGAGIGVTPLVSMLQAMAHAARRRNVYAIFGFRSSAEHPFKDHLHRLGESNRGIHLHMSYSAPLKSDVLYRDYNHRGRLTIDRIRDVLPSSNFRFYVCGPSQMMESLVPALWDWGVPQAHVHFEAFGPASVKSSAARNRGNVAETCDVRFERSQRAVKWDGTFASLLEFGEAAGLAMPSGCRAGSCGECLMRVHSGSVNLLKPPGIAVPAGHCLTCISTPAGAVTLDA